MIKGYINSVVSKHLYGWALGEHLYDVEPLDFYNVLNDKLEELTRAGNLPIFPGFYTEYLGENETYNRLDDKFVIRNYQ
jgi:hypothetical protein